MGFPPLQCMCPSPLCNGFSPPQRMHHHYVMGFPLHSSLIIMKLSCPSSSHPHRTQQPVHGKKADAPPQGGKGKLPPGTEVSGKRKPLRSAPAPERSAQVQARDGEAGKYCTSSRTIWEVGYKGVAWLARPNLDTKGSFIMSSGAGPR